MTDEQKNMTQLSIWLIAVLLIMAAAFAIALSTADAQYGRPYVYPDPREWGPEEQQRRMPPMPRMEERPRYDDQERYGRGRPISPEEYERRSYCVMHPRECQ